jgi:hypothetical protein
VAFLFLPVSNSRLFNRLDPAHHPECPQAVLRDISFQQKSDFRNGAN